MPHVLFTLRLQIWQELLVRGRADCRAAYVRIHRRQPKLCRTGNGQECKQVWNWKSSPIKEDDRTALCTGHRVCTLSNSLLSDV